jgi:hypothetical protein
MPLGRAKPEPRAEPSAKFKVNGEAEPRLTSGGEAVAKKLLTRSRSKELLRHSRSEELLRQSLSKTLRKYN